MLHKGIALLFVAFFMHDSVYAYISNIANSSSRRVVHHLAKSHDKIDHGFDRKESNVDFLTSTRKVFLEKTKNAFLLGSFFYLTNTKAVSAADKVKKKKITNIDEAREIGEVKEKELEEAKGPLVKLSNGIRYREERIGTGDVLTKDMLAKVKFNVYKGNGDYMFSCGYEKDFKNDFDETYDFVFGKEGTLPKSAEMGMEGMKVGGIRKILVSPLDNMGWYREDPNDVIYPQPTTFSGKRKLSIHIKEPLQFEVELVRIRKRK